MRGTKPTPKAGPAESAELFENRSDLEPAQFMLPKALRKELKIAAVNEERSMSAILRDALEAYFAANR